MTLRTIPLILYALTFQVWAQGIATIETVVATNDLGSRPRRVLFFAQQNNFHHKPADFIDLVREDFGQSGIVFETSTLSSQISDAGFSGYDGVFFYGNHNNFSTTGQQALVDYIENGGGMVGMHVFSYVVRNSPLVRDLLGGGFLGHHAFSNFSPVLIQTPEDYPANLALHPNFPFPSGGTYLSDPNHPILQGLESYTSVDEPFINKNFNPDLILLGHRTDVNGWDEPYTWVRYQGSGRVFYHGNGHDSRTWSQPNFRELMIRGTNWVSKTDGAGPFQTLFPPVISSDGSIQHFATVGPIGSEILALYSNDYQSAIDSGQVPGNSESLDYSLSQSSPHLLFEDGQIAFEGQILEQGALTSALFAGHPRYPSIVARTGGEADILEAGFLFQGAQTFPFRANQSGTILYLAKIEDTAGLNQKSGLILHTAALSSSLLLEGSPLSADPTLLVAQLDETQFSLSEPSSVALIADLEDNSLNVSPHLVGGNPTALSSWLKQGEVIDEISANTSISTFQSVSALDSDTATFTATITGPGVTPSNDQIIALVNSMGEIELVFREGQLLNAQAVSFSSPEILTKSYQNRTIALGTMSGDSALLEMPHGGTPHLVLKEGQSVSVEGTTRTVDTIDDSSLMASPDHLTILVTLLPTATLNSSKCLLHFGRSGVPLPIMLDGWQVETSSGNLTVAEIECHPTSQPGSGINLAGAASFLVSDPAGSDAIVKIANLDNLDNDCYSDTVETAFGGDPQIFSNQSPPGYPEMVQSSPTEVDFTFWQIQASPLTSKYRLEISTDLINWTDTQATFSQHPDQSGVLPQYLRMMATVPTSSVSSFYRFAF